ncbi:hypothetical protein NXX91_04500 [Bacteroides thetaiotaomicron]|nr:hypothetical protein [Bacteroides thetaiotaomicron]
MAGERTKRNGKKRKERAVLCTKNGHLSGKSDTGRRLPILP